MVATINQTEETALSFTSKDRVYFCHTFPSSLSPLRSSVSNRKQAVDVVFGQHVKCKAYRKKRSERGERRPKLRGEHKENGKKNNHDL